MLQTCCFRQSSLCLLPWTGSPRPSSRGFRCVGAPTSPSAAPSSLNTQEAPSSSPSPPPTRHTTTPSQLSITPLTSCFLLQTPPTKETTAVFMASMFLLITSPLRAVCCLSLSQIQQFISSDRSSCW
ncbi:non-specific lipid transfer protein GPI-anchored 23-like [Thunnus maccoyii]|uniref:non-specific lipid transfer protein GPI-anchored 23-like n=1 Tax=Thunnus maccoyii TaxID=8240 RepID=UPI001C4DA540|nr:non-specific lipid transfer protein GPI-anchored 23-like [Thunnus maccoyii]